MITRVSRSIVLAGAALAGCASTPQPHASTPAPRVAEPASAPAPDPALVRALDDVAATTFKTESFLGLAIAVVRDHRVVLAKGYGWRDLARTQPMAADSELAIGSLTKQFTAAAVLQLVDAGKVKLDDRIDVYVPSVHHDVTIAQLLHQTTGLPDYARNYNLGKSTAELVTAIAGEALAFAPGTRWEYSNSNYFLLGRVIEAASGVPYADYIRDMLAPSAGLTATHVCASLAGSVLEGDEFAAGQVIAPAFYDAAGAMCSTAPDLLRWQDALFGGKVVSARSLAFMIGPGALTDGTPTTYGAGLLPDVFHDHRRIWHNGAVPSGYESELSYFPDDHLQIVVLSDTLHPGSGMVPALLDGSLAVTALAIPPPPLAAFVGAYTFGDGAITISIADGALHAVLADGHATALVRLAPTIYALAVAPRTVYAFKIVDGKATGITVLYDGDKVGAATRTH